MLRYQKAIETRQARRRALVDLHHRLSTPASAIATRARILADSAPGPLAAQLRRIGNAAEDLIERLDDLVHVGNPEDTLVGLESAELNAELKHELATSMHVILGSCEIIQDGSIGQSSPVPDQEIERIVDATHRLLAIVEQATSLDDDRKRDEGAPRTGQEAQPVRAAARVLVVDDDAMNRELLVRHLERQGLKSAVAVDGAQALEMLAREPYDLVLLDIVMPELDGFQVLERMRADAELRHVPVLVISAMDDMDSVVRCIELGADDHLPKTFNKTLFDARVQAVLERKRLHDEAAIYTEQLRLERRRSDDLLLNVLPAAIAERLKLGETTIADSFDAVTVVFCDIVGFTGLAERTPPRELVARLNALVTTFDDIAERFGVEKLKTIGDAYMIVSGIPHPRPDHAVAAADAALAMLNAVEEHNFRYADALQVRIGMHSGPVVAGVIGRKRCVYDVWGDTVNVASRMESQGLRGCIQTSRATYELLRDHFDLECRGKVRIRGKGHVPTYLLLNPVMSETPPARASAAR